MDWYWTKKVKSQNILKLKYVDYLLNVNRFENTGTTERDISQYW